MEFKIKKNSRRWKRYVKEKQEKNKDEGRMEYEVYEKEHDWRWNKEKKEEERRESKIYKP